MADPSTTTYKTLTLIEHADGSESWIEGPDVKATDQETAQSVALDRAASINPDDESYTVVAVSERNWGRLTATREVKTTWVRS
jgi:hypothetical protein